MPWTLETRSPLSGSASARSGGIGASQRTDLYVNVNCARSGMVTFLYRVSSESCCDFLFFFVDGVQQGRWGGTVPSTVQSYPLTLGTHTLRWRYFKDGSVNTGEDAAFIDDVTVANCSP